MTDETDRSERTYKYGSREEAQRRFEERVLKRKMTLCPLTHATCSTDCVCYDEPGVVNIETGGEPFWDCRGGNCTCYMLMGPI